VRPIQAATTTTPAVNRIGALRSVPTVQTVPRLTSAAVAASFFAALPHHHRFFWPYLNPYYAFGGYPFAGYGWSYPYYPYYPSSYGPYFNPYAYNPYAFNPYANAYASAGSYGDINPYASSGPGSGSPGTAAPLAAQAEIVVPDSNADVWFNGEKSNTQGVTRVFTSPPLDPAGQYRLTIKASWNEGGQAIAAERTITLTAGAHVKVEFSKGRVRVSTNP
jgi:uncharacterized protein (TIGR03000 family)